MPSQKVYAKTVESSWEAPAGDHAAKPGFVVQFTDGDYLAVAAGDLALDGGVPDLPRVNVLDFLPLPANMPPGPGFDAGVEDEPYPALAEAIQDAIDAAYLVGMSTPRYVRLSRREANEVIASVRRGRGYAFGADE